MKEKVATPSGVTPRLAAPGAPLDSEQVLTGFLSVPPKKKKQSRPPRAACLPHNPRRGAFQKGVKFRIIASWVGCLRLATPLSTQPLQ